MCQRGHQRFSSIFLILFIHSFAGKSRALINDTLLSNLLRPLSAITLRLRTNEDASNGFVQFFLNQNLCPLKLISHDFVERNKSRNNVIMTNTSDFKSDFEKHSTRLGTQFYIMEKQFEPTAVVDIARTIWNRLGIFKNYFIASNSVYFYNPFVLDSLSGIYGALQNTSDWRDLDNIFQNINGYPLRTYIFRSVYVNVVYDRKTNKIERAEGADAEVAYAIEKIMNGKMILEEPDGDFFGYHLPNGSYSGAIGRVIRYETDLVLTGFFIKDYFTQDMEFSVSVYTDKLCCYVSKAKRIPQSILPLFSVKIDMWVGFIGAAFVWSAIWIAIRKINLWVNRKKGRPVPKELTKTTTGGGDWPYFRIFSDTWVIWVRANICQYPPFSSEKVFVISLCLVSVIFGAIFESSLATVYITPLYYNDINTMQELDESQLKILIKHPAMKDDLFHGSVSVLFNRLDKKLLLVSNIVGPMIEAMARKGGFASVTRASSLMIDDIDYILSEKIHQISECPKKYRIAYVYPKESPYKERVNDILLRFINAGLINHWIEMMYHKARIGILKSPEILKVMGGYTWKELTIIDLQLAFYVIIGGSLLSTIVLITEIYIARRSLKKQFKNKN